MDKSTMAMALLALLRKELHWTRRHIPMLLLLLILIPGLFGLSTVIFQDVLPRDAPVAVVPANESTTAEELEAITGPISLVGEPRVMNDTDQAMRSLHREQVYAVFAVEGGLFNESNTVTVTMYIEEAIVPYEEPSIAVASILQRALNRGPGARIIVNREPIGPDHTLSGFLFPVGVMLLFMVFAFAFLPYNLASEESVLRRLRVETSMRTVMAAKLIYLTGLMILPLLAFIGLSSYLGYPLTWSLASVGIYLLTFTYLGAIASAIMLVTNFSTTGRFLNIAVLFGLLLSSNLAYPAGYFSPIRREISRAIPLHYSMIAARSFMMKDVSWRLFSDWILGLIGITIACGLILWGAIIVYERRQ